MSQGLKSAYYRALKDAGVQFDKHYRQYSTDELKAAHERLVVEGAVAPLQEPQPLPPKPVPATEIPAPPPGYQAPVVTPVDREPVIDADAAAFFGLQSTPPVRQADPNEMAGQRLNSKEEDEPLRTDEQGRVWFQEEVLKPAFPKPRGRRVLTYMDPGTETKTVKAGDYMESFEVAGDPKNARPAEVKITLPSYQVGVYKDPRFPFKIHTYNGTQGFDLFQVQEFYGGAELVPQEIKRAYVENVLCYDIRTTVRAIETEYRQRVLAGRNH